MVVSRVRRVGVLGAQGKVGSETESGRANALSVAIGELADLLQDAGEVYCRGIPAPADLQQTVHSPRIPFHPALQGMLRDAANDLGYAHRDLVSGAGHDAFHIAKVIPAALMFIPCENGVSHNESENISFEDAQAGGNVLLQAVLRAANGPEPLDKPA